MTERKALVIGATGGIGGAVAAALLRHGWQVRAMTRRDAPPVQNGIDWVRGDAMVAADVIAAAEGTQVIFHGANPPGYRNWRGLALPMLRASIAAAEAHGARLIFPGTIYNFGPDAWPVLHEGAPQNPLTRKGKVRAEMEALLHAATARGTRALVLRAGDFFGPEARSSWFSQAIIEGGKPVRRITWPGVTGGGHAFAYLPDLAEAFALLADREAELGAMEDLHFAGHFVDDAAMAGAVRRAVGDETLKLGRFPWWLMTLGAPFNTFFREVRELRYLWKEPLRLDNARLVALLGAEPHTALDQAVRDSLIGLGSMPKR
ncbi:NAD-dependent epimerase/dehydratase family protein [Plastoroseomonas arctica]|uniref:NAD(P)H-binding protein n=1 Tax=Plastoroseomonas arctica TaxID=1509237 RepID=A0AAF1KPV8_9PROT|nr:NAD-dependent epimerase/dehydratase family protein [Plastoroseomonas arctica]MBR0656593.1 NAD(P)H-binding protein [Plastoroseomonas arctica]